MKKSMKKCSAALLAFGMCAALTACGSGSGSTSAATQEANMVTEAQTEAPTEAQGLTIASTQTWGDYTVGVPEGWEFKKGDTLDETDTRYCSVKKSSFVFFDFKMETEDVCKNKYEYNKKTYTNEQKDVSGKYGDIEWTGFDYSDGFGGYGFEAYATANGKPVRVSCCGYKFDTAEAKAVLETLKIK
ncbi:MAG: hypothetical protein IKN79_02555 [Eubacterium sp.]|nr:hypothetical protein [Eubacterium sp.]